MSQPDDHADNHPATVKRNSRNGLMLFAVYVVSYLGFMLLSAFAPDKMKQPFISGLNLAIVYGMGLIVLALALAMVYMWLCRNKS